MNNPSIFSTNAGVGHRQLKGLLDYSAAIGKHTLETEDARKKKLKKKTTKKQEA